MITRSMLILVSIGLVASTTSAQTVPRAASSTAQPQATSASRPMSASSITTLETVVVTGVLPGPGLWKITGKDGHVLWVLGVIQTLPAGMQWRSAQVKQVIAASQAVIEQPKVKLKLDTGFFGKLFLIPAALGARKNPDGKTLHDVLPAPMYARWEVLKHQYIGNDDGIEQWRPIFAALKLYGRALKTHGLRNAGSVEDTVDALAKQDGVPVIPTTYTLLVREPRQAIKAFEAAGPDGVACFGRTLDSIEHDIPAMTARANAWATGDIDTLSKLPDSHFRNVCKDAVTGAGFARQLGIDNLPANVQAHWLGVARMVMARNAQSFAILPMDEMLDAGGFLDTLKAQGYLVQSPDDLANQPPASAASAANPVVAH